MEIDEVDSQDSDFSDESLPLGKDSDSEASDDSLDFEVGGRKNKGGRNSRTKLPPPSKKKYLSPSHESKMHLNEGDQLDLDADNNDSHNGVDEEPCSYCRMTSNADKMLLCDKCDLPYHMYCLQPKLRKVPEGDWFCPDCKNKKKPSRPRSQKTLQEPVDEQDGADDEHEGTDDVNEKVFVACM